MKIGSVSEIRAMDSRAVEIFGISGESLVLRDLKGAGTEKVLPEAPAGWYLVRITSGEEVGVTKVFINSSQK